MSGTPPNRMEVTRVQEGPQRGKYTVALYDPTGRPICWCGPYDLAERDKTINLFRPHGWMKRNGVTG